MRNFMNGISKGLAFVLAAAMVFTSVPSPVLADTLSLDTAVESNELTDAASVVDASAEISDSQVATDGDLIDSGIEVAAETADAADLEATTEGEEENVEPDGASRNAVFVNKAGLVGLDNLTYGVDFSTARAFANDSNGNKFTEVTWTLKSIEADQVGDHYSDNDTPANLDDDTPASLYRKAYADYYVAARAYQDAASTTNIENLAKARTALVAYFEGTTEALPTGITSSAVTTGDSKGYYVFDGERASQVCDNWYVLVAEDADGNIGYSDAFELKVKGVTVLAGTSSDDDAYWDGTGTALATAATIPAVTDGYTVYESKAKYDTAKAADDSINGTYPINVILKTTTVTSGGKVVLPKETSYKFTDRATVKNGKTVDYFTVSADETDLYTGHNVVLTITPSSTLTSAGGSHTYTGYLHITNTYAFDTPQVDGQPEFKNDVVVKVEFTVGQGITFKAVTGTGESAEEVEPDDKFYSVGTETKTAAHAAGHYKKVSEEYVLETEDGDATGTYYAISDGTEAHPFYLGEFAIGEPINAVITATSSGVDQLQISSPEGLPDDVTFVRGPKGNPVTLTIGGQAAQADKANYKFSVRAYDTTTENQETKWYAFDTIEVDETTDDVPGLSVTIDGKTGEDLGAGYEWFVAGGVTTADKAIKAVIKNDTATQLKVTPTFAKTSSVVNTDLKITPAVGEITLAAGESREYTITPVTLYNDGADAVVDADVTGTFGIDGIANQITAQTFTLSYTRKGDEVTITKPEDNDTAITDAFYGLAYKGYTFEATKASGISKVSYEIITDAAIPTEVTPSVGDNPASEGWYELEGRQFVPTEDGSVVSSKRYFAGPATSSLATVDGKLALDIADAGYTLTSAADLNTNYGLKLSKDGALATETTVIDKNGTGATVLHLLVQATYVKGTTTGYTYRLVQLPVEAPKFKDAVTVTYNGTSVNTSKKFTLPAAGMGDEDLEEAELVLTNNLGVDIPGKDDLAEAVKATITGVDYYTSAGAKTSLTAGQIAAQFQIGSGWTDETTVTAIGTNDVAIEKGKTAKINIATIAAPGDNATNTNPTTAIAPGKYEITIHLESAYLDDDLDIVATMNVSAAPVIDVSKIRDYITTGGAPFTYMKEVVPVTVGGVNYAPAFVSTLSTGASVPGDFTYSWAKNEDSILDIITESGLTLNPSGVISGTPLKAGNYLVDVTSTYSKDGTTSSTTIPYTITIEGTATVTSGVGTVANMTAGYTYVAPGVIKGTQGLVQIKLKGDASKTATNVKVTLSDAEDDRDTTAAPTSYTGKDIKNNPDNPYEGKASLFSYSDTPFTLAANQEKVIDVTLPATTEAGEYRVKATITGDNIGQKSFYFIVAVVDELTFADILAANGTVGDAYSKDIKATGGVKDAQHIAYTLKTGSTITGKTGLALSGDAEDEDTGYYKNTLAGTPTAAYDDDVTVVANVTAVTLDTDASVVQHKDEAAKYVGYDSTAFYPAQTNVEKTFHVVIGPSNKVAYGLSYASGTWTAPKSDNITGLKATLATAYAYNGSSGDDGYDTNKGIVGDKLGADKYKEITGYVFEPLTEEYAANDRDILYLTLYNGTGINLTANFSINSEDFAYSTIDDDSNGFTAVPGKKYKSKVLVPGNNIFVITPATELGVGTHTAVLTVESDAVSTLTFNLTQVVEAATYSAGYSYLANAKLEDGTPITEIADAKKEEGYTVIGSNPIELSPVIKGEDTTVAGTPTMDRLFIQNTGNQAITNVTITEVDASGVVVDLDANKKLYFFDAAGNRYDGSRQFAASLLPDGEIPVLVAPKNTTKAGEYTAYLSISYKGASAVPVETIVAVKFVVCDMVNGLTLTPDTSVVTLNDIAEGADPATSTGGEIKLTNSNATKPENTLYNLSVTLIATKTTDNPAAFQIVYDGKTKSAADIKKLAPGADVTFKVIPAAELPYGTHTASVLISGDNLDESVVQDVQVKVTQSEDYEVDTYTGAVTVNNSYAQRMYNTLAAIVAENTETGNEKFVKVDGSNNKVYYVDVDNVVTGTPDLTITFTTIGAATPAYNNVTGMSIVHADQVINVPFKKVTLTSKELAKVTKNTPDPVDPSKMIYDPHFASIKFNFFSTVSLMATYNDSRDLAEIVAGTKKAYEDSQVIYVAGSEVEDAEHNILGITGKKDATTPNDDGYAANTAYVVVVQNGSTAASVFGGSLPTATKTGYAFEGWEIAGADVDETRPVTRNEAYTIKWHGHHYPVSWDETEENKSQNPNVVWTWVPGTKTGEYSDVSVTIYCDSDKCPNRASSAQTFKTKDTTPTIALDGKAQEATCTKGTRYDYVASITVGSATYTSTRSSGEDKSTIKGHDYKPTVSWVYDENAKAYVPTVVLECKRDGCTDATEGHKYTIKGADVTVSTTEDPAPTCVKEGRATYTITSFKAGGKTYTPADFAEYTTVEWNVSKDIPAKGHTYGLEVEWNEDHKTVKTAKLVCKVCDDKTEGHTLDVSTSVTYDLKTDESGKAISNQAIYAAGTENEVRSAIWTDHKHEWTEKWDDWARSSLDDKFSWTTKLTLTCTKGLVPEEVTPAVTIDKKPDGDKYIDYVATATYEGVTYTSTTLTVDAKTGEKTSKHTHVWTLSGWTWDTKDDAKATFICTVGGTPETETVVATVTVLKTNSKGNSYCKATAKYPDGTNEAEKYQWFDPSGNPTTGEGFGIEGLESEYKYTGKNITPDFIVVDYALDKVLTPSTDYSFKFSNNKNVGTATLTVTGKGNYGVKGGVITASFDIVDPMKDEDVSTYYDTVSGVKASKDKYTYDGTPKYPTTLEIKVKEGRTTSTVVAKLNSSGDGYDLPEGSKDLMIVVENNVKKGSGTVAVTGKDKKAKSATFSIGAADMSALGDKLVVTAEEAVYTKNGAKANVKVTFDGNDLVAGRDFTVSYKYADKKNAGEKMGSVIVKGKNNFTKSAPAVQFDITKIALADENVVVEAYDKTQAKSLKVSVYDSEGNAINKKFYSITEIKDEEGNNIAGTSTKLEAGKSYDVTIKGDGKNVDETEHTVSVVAGVKLSSAKVDAKSVVKTYTGEPIELTDEDLEKISVSVKINKVDTKLVAGEDFEIIGYQNNNKKGSMKVIIKGIGDKVKGTKTFTVKVNPTVVKKGE